VIFQQYPRHGNFYITTNS